MFIVKKKKKEPCTFCVIPARVLSFDFKVKGNTQKVEIVVFWYSFYEKLLSPSVFIFWRCFFSFSFIFFFYIPRINSNSHEKMRAKKDQSFLDLWWSLLKYTTRFFPRSSLLSKLSSQSFFFSNLDPFIGEVFNPELSNFM